MSDFNLKNQLRTDLRLLAIVAFFFVLQAQFLKPKIQSRTDYIAPPIELKYLNAGFSTQAADSFWIRAVQDMDHCDQPINERECTGKSWLFNVIDLTVELDQKFKEAYYYGALALTILISDYAGASVIFDKGVEVFNKEWRLLYVAGYHALFEEKNKLKASKRFMAAAENGAPSWLRLSAGRLASEGGDNTQARLALERMIETETDPRWIEKLKKKIESSK